MADIISYFMNIMTDTSINTKKFLEMNGNCAFVLFLKKSKTRFFLIIDPPIVKTWNTFQPNLEYAFTFCKSLSTDPLQLNVNELSSKYYSPTNVATARLKFRSTNSAHSINHYQFVTWNDHYTIYHSKNLNHNQLKPDSNFRTL